MNRALLVDDDAGIVELVSRILSAMDFEVETAVDSATALRHLDSGPFELIITDIEMQCMDGLSLASEIRERKPDIATIVMTGHASMDSAIAAIRAGACDYLVKPFQSSDAVRAIIMRAMATNDAMRERDEIINALKDSNEDVHDLAILDGLTGVYNRRHLLELLGAEFERAVRYRRELSLLFIDVDHFKDYNDRNGHPRGDEVLQRITCIFTNVTRQSDAVGRWGGEKFVVVVPETTEQAASALAEKLRARVAEYDFPGGEKQPGGCVSISIGVATLIAGDSQQALIERADKALSAAKSAGRNTVKNAA